MKKDLELNRKDDFYEVNFTNLMLEEAELANKTFENCEFTKSNFNNTKFTECKFIDCEFESCNISLTEFKNTLFSETIFENCQLSGINWTKVRWPIVNLCSPIKFYKCNISHSSFFELVLTEIVAEECKAHGVDFRGADLSQGSFILTDFDSSLFMHTKLYAADFSEAINYNIDPMQNNILKGKFSMPDAMNLLRGFEIEID